jgi:hypothetical protein
MSLGATAVIGRRTCAVLAATSAVLHAVMLGHAANIAMAVLMSAMIVACLYCARDLWLRGTPGVWCLVALMNLAMIALHVPAPAHHHAAHVVAAGQQPAVMGLATGLSAIEVLFAVAVLVCGTRRRSPLIGGTPAR